MIINNKSDNEYIVYVDNPRTQYINVLSELKLLRGDHQPYKYVDIDLYGRYQIGNGKSIDAVIIKAKHRKIIVIKNSIDFTYNGTNVHDLALFMNTYGTTNTIITFNSNTSISGGFHANGNIMSNSKRETIEIGKYSNESDIQWVKKAIHYLSNNQGQMLMPVIKKFHDITYLVRSHHKELVGYANLVNYMNAMRLPSNGGSSNGNMSDIQSDYVININRTPTQFILKIEKYSDGILYLKCIVDGSFESSSTYNKPNPYILFTTQPLKMGTSVLPYQIIKYKGRVFFISPLVFNSDKYLRGLRGGINLLK